MLVEGRVCEDERGEGAQGEDGVVGGLLGEGAEGVWG